MTTQPIESHEVHSRRMLDHAAEMIAQGDRVQASEKIWGAAAHKVKQIATERGWPNVSHADGHSIVRHLASASGEQDIRRLFGIASDTHQNHYEDRLSIDELADRLNEVHTLISLLNDAHQTLPADLPRPTDRHYLDRHGAAG